MEFVKINVSYRDKVAQKNVSLGQIDTPRFSSVDEAVSYFESEEGEGKGIGALLDAVHTANDIELQRKHRDATRPDKTKTSSNLSVFKQLSQAQQEDLLRTAGLLKVE